MFSVVPFDYSTFNLLIRNYSSSISDTVGKKRQVTYVCKYLKALNASTIVIESDYTESHYIQDYIHYYSSSFFENGRKCYRFHFFDNKTHRLYKKKKSGDQESEKYLGLKFTTKEFEDLLFFGNSSTISEESLQRGYLGFLVVKPLQESIIGKTCLRAYEENPDKRRRCFRATHSIAVNLYGLDLEVERSLPFQEQDSVVSVCATSAIWSFFHAFSQRSNMLAPSTAKIFNSISQNIFLPTKLSAEESGLNISAVVSALEHFGIEPTGYETKNFSALQELILAYMDNLHEPLLLLLDRYEYINASEVDEGEGNVSMRLGFKGAHLVVVTGYGMRNINEVEEEQKNSGSLKDSIDLFPERLDRLYVHDDQIGPFAKLKISILSEDEIDLLEARPSMLTEDIQLTQSECFYFDDNEDAIAFLQYELKDNDDVDILSKYFYTPRGIITGRPSKVKSKYTNIRKGISGVSALLCAFLSQESISQCSWKIRLTLSNEYKCKLREYLIDKEFRHKKIIKDILVTNLPRYIWECTLLSESDPVFDLILDATDLLTLNSCFLGVMVYDVEAMNDICFAWQENVNNTIKMKKESVRNGTYDDLPLNIMLELEEDLLVEEFRKYLESPIHNTHEEINESFFSEALPPVYIYPDERYPDGSIKTIENTLSIAINKKSNFKLNNLEKSHRYLWLIDYKFIYFAPEIDEEIPDNPGFKLGHPCLNNGEDARLAGELNWDSESERWKFTNASGRYCSLRKKHVYQLEAFIILLRQKGFIDDENCIAELSEYHSSDRFGTIQKAKDEIAEFFSTTDRKNVNEEEINIIIAGLPSDSSQYVRMCFKIAKFYRDKVRDIDRPRDLAYLCYQLIKDDYDSRFVKGCNKLNATNESLKKLEEGLLELIQFADEIYMFSRDSKEHSIVVQLVQKIGVLLRNLPFDKGSPIVLSKVEYLSTVQS